jgi:hypothetical protein
MLELLGTLIFLLLVGPLILIGAGGLMLIAAALPPSTARRVRETFLCPWTKRVVTVDFLVPVGATHPSDVASCTAFRDPSRVTCPKGCREHVMASFGLSRGIFPRWALTAGGLVTWRDANAPAR